MKLIAENTQSTVVSVFEHNPSKRVAYQSEAQLEEALLKQLENQGYERLDANTEEELITNLRYQLEQLNDIKFTDDEWNFFFNTHIANKKATLKDIAKLLHDDRSAQLTFPREDGHYQNIKLIDKRAIHQNHLQVIHQYTPTGGRRKNRYDVTILVNGIPMVHIELKKRGVAIREAFNQIGRYQRESFTADCGLFKYLQLFVISNGTETKYYSNTTRDKSEIQNGQNRRHKITNPDGKPKTNDSFDFTSYWADFENNIISDLEDFAATFFAKHTLLNILTRYCVYTAKEELLVMRPYQISATEAIIQRINIATNQHKEGTIDAGGYIWHTTGSGKTLTSFKTAQLCTRLDIVDKVLFVVDRKDLDYQTIKEYEKFKEGCVQANKSTKELKEQIEDDSTRIVITTIQKLNTFCKTEHQHKIYNQHVVIIFDECHRSQFGQMHKMIVKRFKKYHIFGFTGTPIFPENAQQELQTTEQVFGRRLHTYTVVHAIADNNVLPFRVEYFGSFKQGENIQDEQVNDINRPGAFHEPKRIEGIVRYVLKNYDRKTKRNELDSLTNKRLLGFNSIFATDSIKAAKLYYEEFKRQQESLPEEERLKIGLIYSFGVNEELTDTNGMLAEEDSDSTEALDQSSRDFLDAAIQDYNAMFGMNFDTSSEKFPNYYKDVSDRMKKRELDMLIVVNMFLTGFDAPTLNTLWVDKNLRQHGLMQAYSRTNRILNSAKMFGMIVCFRNLENETNEAITMFGDKDKKGLVLLRTYEDYINGYTDEKGEYHPGFIETVTQLKDKFPLSSDLHTIGEKAEKDFIRLFGTYLKMVNLLSTFDQFEDDQPSFISIADDQDYKSLYLDLRDKYRPQTEGDAVNINDDLVFEIELIKQVEINIDFILSLIERNRLKQADNQDVNLEDLIGKAIGSSPALRNKRDLIEAFVKQCTPGKEITPQWITFVDQQAQDQLQDIIDTEHLKPERTREFMRHAFQIGEVELNGTHLAECLPNIPLFGGTGNYSQIKQRVAKRFLEYFDRFYDIYDFPELHIHIDTFNDNRTNLIIEK